MNRLFIPSIALTGLLMLSAGTLFPARQSMAEPERTVEILYHFTVRGLPAGTKDVTAWIPIPPSNKHQDLEGLHVEGDLPYTILEEPEYGNRFIHLDLSRAGQKERNDITVAVTFRVNRKPYRVVDHPEIAVSAAENNLDRFLAPDSLIPIDGEIAREAERVAGALKQPLARARSLYDHIVQSLVYDKTGQGWGRGDAIYACDIRSGNCTDFHSLFIGEARALGIPARFVMGLPLPEGLHEGKIPGYHCWAEFYIEGWGWIPVDASEAQKHPEKRDALFGGLDQNRVEFTMGRDIGIPRASSGPLNYVIYPHVEVHGKLYNRVETSFSFRERASGDKLDQNR